VCAAGLSSSDRVWGFDEAGRLRTEDLLGAIDLLAVAPDGTGEFGTHPGEATDPDRERYASWGYRWGEELEILISPTIRERLRRKNVSLVHYGALRQHPP
jgi:hypothetical protein